MGVAPWFWPGFYLGALLGLGVGVLSTIAIMAYMTRPAVSLRVVE